MAPRKEDFNLERQSKEDLRRKIQKPENTFRNRKVERSPRRSRKDDRYRRTRSHSRKYEKRQDSRTRRQSKDDRKRQRRDSSDDRKRWDSSVDRLGQRRDSSDNDEGVLWVMDIRSPADILSRKRRRLASPSPPGRSGSRGRRGIAPAAPTRYHVTMPSSREAVLPQAQYAWTQPQLAGYARGTEVNRLTGRVFAKHPESGEELWFDSHGNFFPQFNGVEPLIGDWVKFCAYKTDPSVAKFQAFTVEMVRHG